MKMTFAALIISFATLTSTAYANSSKAAAAVCYKATTAVPKGAPKAICLRDLEIGSNMGSVTVNTDLEDTTKRSVNVISFVRHNENRAKFQAMFEIQGIDGMPGCGEGAQIYVQLTGQAYAIETPAVVISSLQVSYNEQYDVCHSPTTETIINYALAK